jgi:hypothetical protein
VLTELSIIHDEIRRQVPVDTVAVLDVPAWRGAPAGTIVTYICDQGRDGANRPIPGCLSFGMSAEGAKDVLRSMREDPALIPVAFTSSPLGRAIAERGVQFSRPEAVSFVELGVEVFGGLVVDQPDVGPLQRWWKGRNERAAREVAEEVVNDRLSVPSQHRLLTESGLRGRRGGDLRL